MTDAQLTRHAQRMLAHLVYLYRLSLDNGEDPEFAVYLGDAQHIYQTLTFDSTLSLVVSSCRELSSVGMVNLLDADDSFSDCELLPTAIAYAENRFQRSLSSLLNFIQALK